MRMIVPLVFAALFMVLFTATGADAASYTCTVVQAGPVGTTASGGGKILLTDTAATPAFTGKAFYLPAERTKEFLAVALTALINDKKVKVTIDAQLKNITAIYLIK